MAPVSPVDGGLDPETVSDLLGGLDVETTASVEVPERLVDRVVGQARAREVVEKAALQRRHVLLIGLPGTGKSMLAHAMSELLPGEGLEDVVVYHNPDDGNRPRVRVLPAGQGAEVVGRYRDTLRNQAAMGSAFRTLLLVLVLVYTVFVMAEPLVGVIAVGLLSILFRTGRSRRTARLPKLLVDNGGRETAPFEDATGTHAGALLGDVRHDPFQSGGLETPSHDRVEPGAIHRANGGVLFIDEVNTLDVRSQQHLLTAVQEREFAVTGQSERSSGAMVRTDPVPTDFVMVAAGNLDAVANMHPALRSRLKGYGYEVYMDDSLEDTPENRRALVRFVAQEVGKDGRLPHFTREALAEVVLEARRRAGRRGRLTLELRDLGGLVRVAGDVARSEDAPFVRREHVLRAKRRSRSVERQLTDHYLDRRRDYDLTLVEGAVVGRANGLTLVGDDVGVVLPVVADVTPAQGEGRVVATGGLRDAGAESMAHVAAVVKKAAGRRLAGRDIHVQFVGNVGGVRGDASALAVVTAVVSALSGVPVDQSVAVAGALSVRGDVLPVPNVTARVEAAAAAGVERVVLPAANRDDVLAEAEALARVEIVPVSHVGEALAVALVGDAPDFGGERDSAVGRLVDAARAFRPDLPGTDPTPERVSADGRRDGRHEVADD
ncbi:ATP-dependent protease LonB [Halobium salinum]|uniref:Archaeal Lon protease n=1 Tax=Halobium salinum TaxID=1364940 RepID=A0ABD5PAQ6_9EURY|nr:ATP-dependent protease LonB [Halobium salinum]